MVKYYKKVTIEKEWTQPLATDYSTPVEGGNMVISAESEGSGANSYNAVNPMRHIQPPTSEDQCALASSWKGSGVYWWQVKFPYKLKITAIDLYNAYSSYTNFKEVRLYTDNTKSTQIGVVTDGTTTAYEKKVVQNIPEEGIITDTVYLLFMSKHATSPYNDIGFGGITIYATKVDMEWQPCTKSEYDQLPNDQRKIVTDKHIIDTPKYLKKTVTETAFIQPILSSNGTLGGNSFAVSSDELYYTGEFQTYYGFDNNNSTVIASAFNITSFNVYVYNPVALAVSNINIICPGPYVYEDRFNKLTVYGSNDGKNYELIQSFETEMKTNYSFNLSSDKKYKYYRLLFQNNGQYFRITEIKLTAQEVAEKWQECTKAEYDSLADNERKIVVGQRAFTKQGTLYLA